MAITLGGVDLPSMTIWEDRQNISTILQTREFTLGGKQIVDYYKLLSGRYITLTANESSGWVTKLVSDQIAALADEPGIEYTFVYGAESYQVMFRHETPPAYNAEPLVYRNNQEATDYYTHTINLVTV